MPGDPDDWDQWWQEWMADGRGVLLKPVGPCCARGGCGAPVPWAEPFLPVVVIRLAPGTGWLEEPDGVSRS